jgi:hypothetical protein
MADAVALAKIARAIFIQRSIGRNAGKANPTTIPVIIAALVSGERVAQLSLPSLIRLFLLSPTE